MMLIFILLMFLISYETVVDGYKNYTVGDDLGWFDSLEKPPGVDYQKWTVGKNFSLGDYLLFNTDTNHTVIQTYNHNVYTKCDFSDSDSKDTVEYTGQPSTSINPITLSVPLTKEGLNYFFSSYFGGEQCKYGQKFKLIVTHGEGLPDDLKDSSAASSPTSQPADYGDNSPDTKSIPSNYNIPVPSDDEKVKPSSGCSKKGIGFGGLVVMVLAASWSL